MWGSENVFGFGAWGMSSCYRFEPYTKLHAEDANPNVQPEHPISKPLGGLGLREELMG